MTDKIKFKDLTPGQEFTVGEAQYRKVAPEHMGRICRHCQGNSHNAVARFADYGPRHFCAADIVTIAASVIQVLDDLILEIHEGSRQHPFIRLISKDGTDTDDGPGWLDITDSEVPALIRALIATQPCHACVVIGDAETGQSLLHSSECLERTPF